MMKLANNNYGFYKRALEAKNSVMPPVELREPNYIDNLHEILFEHIFESIDTLSGQVRMARAYPQFIPLIIMLWKRRPQFRIIGPNTYFLSMLDIEDYVFFMALMREHFKELHVQDDGIGCFPDFYRYITHLCDIGITRFPNVECCVLNGNPNTLVNEDIRDLTAILPNLKRLYSCMNLSGIFIPLFRKLEELVFKSMYQSIPLDSRWVQSICLAMPHLRVLDITDSFDSGVRLTDIKLPSLEVLKINLSSVEFMVPQVLQLPRLRKLAIRFDDSRQLHAHQETIFQQIIMAKAENIVRIALNNEVVQLGARWHQSLFVELPRLRALICENWHHDEFFLSRHHIPSHQMQVISFSGWEILREHHLLELVADCPELTHLHLNAYHSNLSKLRKLHTIRTADRFPKLQVFSDNFWKDLEADEFEQWRFDETIQVTCDTSPYAYQEDGFEFDFELS